MTEFHALPEAHAQLAARLTEAERLLALPPAGREVYLRLTALRGRLARETGVAAFRILSNRHLIELSERRPAVESELLLVRGIGPLLVRAYGREIVGAIGETCGRASEGCQPS